MLNINLDQLPSGSGVAVLALLLVLGAVLVHGWPESSPPFIEPNECSELCGGKVVSWSPTWCSCSSNQPELASSRARARTPHALVDGDGGRRPGPTPIRLESKRP